ncbi:MAG: L-type lectin-domain containing protein, partial [Flavobacteriales bacterium]
MLRHLKYHVLCAVLATLFGFSANDALAQPNTIHGNAINLGAGCYRLTNSGNSQRGAVWYGGTVDISQSWEMTADVYLGTSNGGADGMTFVLRDPDASVLGGAGGLMGYGGNFASPAIEPSVSVQIDTYQGNNHNDPWYDHLAIMADGNVTHGNADALAGPITAHPAFNNIENGIEYQLRVTYDANTQVMTVYWDCVERLSEVIDLEGIIGTNEVKWGFTAATGGANNIHRVCDAEWIVVEDVVAPSAITCAGEPIELTLSDYALNPTWSPSLGLSDDSGNSVTATLDESQTYTVTYEDVCEETYTLEVFVEVPELPETGLPQDTIACDASSLVLPNGPWPAGITGTWNDGSTEENYTVSGTGSYTLTLEESTNGCTVSSTVDVVAVVLPDLTLGPDQTTCPGELVSFDLSGTDPALSFTWNGIPGDALFATEQPGTVVVEWNISICSASDEVVIANHPLYDITWEEDPVVLCLDETETVSAVDLNWTGEAVSYAWSTASDQNSIEVNNPGVYSVEVTTDNCTFSYAIEAIDSPNQGVDLGEDVLLCDDDFVTFESGYAAANTLWISGGSASGMNAAVTTVQGNTATVIAEVTVGSCIERDTAYVTHVPFFDGGLPASMDLCLNDSLNLEAELGAESYTWNNGPTVPSQWVNAPGTYTLEMEIGGCTFTDAVVVSPSPNQGVDLGADLITCEGEVTLLSSGYTAAETQWWENGASQGNAASWSVLNDDAVIIAQVTVGACVERDTISIDYAPPFNTGLPSSLPLCTGDSLWLVSNVGAPEYAWNNGASSAGIWVYSPGNYTLTPPLQG